MANARKRKTSRAPRLEALGRSWFNRSAWLRKLGGRVGRRLRRGFCEQRRGGSTRSHRAARFEGSASAFLRASTRAHPSSTRAWTTNSQTCEARCGVSDTGKPARRSSSRGNIRLGKQRASAFTCAPSSTRPDPSRPATSCFGFRTFIDEILDCPAGRALGAVLLEPEQIGGFYGADREQRDLVSLGRGPAITSSTRSSPSRISASRAHPGDRPAAHRGRAARESARRRHPPGRQHPDPAARQELLPDARAQRCAASCTEAVMALLVELRYASARSSRPT